MVEDLLDPLGGHLLGGDAHLFGQIHELVGELHDPRREGRREEHRLALLEGWQLAQDVAQILDEAHVEHAVGLVDDHRLDRIEGEDPLLGVVDEPPRGGDDDVDPLLQGLALLVVVDAAEDRLDAERAAGAQSPGRRRGSAPPAPGSAPAPAPAGPLAASAVAAQQPGEEGDQKSGGLAGAGLRLAGDVLAGQGQGNRLLLDGGELGETDLGDPLEDLLGQVQFGEFHECSFGNRNAGLRSQDSGLS